MSIFDILTLLGGLAMFLYGMRQMGDGLKESSSGTMRTVMGHVTDNSFKAFLLGLFVTAIIQSSTSTIVITSGLVAAGILTLHQSLGIIVGANVGTTITGQIIRLLDIESGATAWLQAFRPSTLAPVALIVGVVFIMAVKTTNAKTIGGIACGFGILFSGLMSMTGAVDSLNESGYFESLFASLSSPFVGYATGAAVAFILQSSSAAIGIMQAFSQSGVLTWNSIYAVIVGIYLGDCVTTAIVCSIGAKEDARRVGIVNILFNFCKTVLVLGGVTIAHQCGWLDSLWNSTVHSGVIANTNSVFNLASALILFPMLPIYEKLSHKIVRDKPTPKGKYDDLLDSLNPSFFHTPAIALNSAYQVLLTIFRLAKDNVKSAFALISDYKEADLERILAEEENIDVLSDSLGDYLVALSPHISLEQHSLILNHYYKMVSEFERLGDHATNIAQMAADMQKNGVAFTKTAVAEIETAEEVLWQTLDYAEQAFEKRDGEAAAHIEPLEEVMDEMVEMMRNNHLKRLYGGFCNVYAGSGFMNLLTDLERISDICSNIGIAVFARVHPDTVNLAHNYITALHSGSDTAYNEEYHKNLDIYLGKLAAIEQTEEQADNKKSEG